MNVSLDEFVKVHEHVTKDARGRVTLGPDVTDEHFMVSRNAVGQILLTPVTAVPTYEMWLWNNPAALASVQRGIAQAANGDGKVIDYSQYADLAIED
jgi:hypothetical protein